jgi:hypothetical protein
MGLALCRSLHDLLADFIPELWAANLNTFGLGTRHGEGTERKCISRLTAKSKKSVITLA